MGILSLYTIYYKIYTSLLQYPTQHQTSTKYTWLKTWKGKLKNIFLQSEVLSELVREMCTNQARPCVCQYSAEWGSEGWLCELFRVLKY